MQNADRIITRCQFVRTAKLAAGLFVVPGAFAEELTRAALRRTVWVEEGPFYPEKLPLDTDNDLVIVNDSITSAVGEITHVAGRVLDARSDPIKDAVVEIWQVDHNATISRSVTGAAASIQIFRASAGSRPDRADQRFTNRRARGKVRHYFRLHRECVTCSDCAKELSCNAAD